MVFIDQDKCIGCGVCAGDCVGSRIELIDGTAHIKGPCILCGHCVAICPVSAVSIPEYDMEDVETYRKETFELSPEQLLRTIKFRRSIRDYKPEPISQHLLEELLQAGRYTATARNSQSCHFIFVQKELDSFKQLLWDEIGSLIAAQAGSIPRELIPFASFYKRRNADRHDDFLFRNAPALVFITADTALDAGLAAQNMELMAVSNGLGALYNGYLAGIANRIPAVREWLSLSPDETIHACMLLGYPHVFYERTAPRRIANVTWK